MIKRVCVKIDRVECTEHSSSPAGAASNTYTPRDTREAAPVRCSRW
jgi:hypothetical protein